MVNFGEQGLEPGVGSICHRLQESCELCCFLWALLSWFSFSVELEETFKATGQFLNVV